jgi:hypothetical protein
MGRVARAMRDNGDTKSSQPHNASYRELLRSCIGKVAAWINEVGWRKGVQNEPLHTKTPQSPRRSCRVCLNLSLNLLRNTRIDYEWQ